MCVSVREERGRERANEEGMVTKGRALLEFKNRFDSCRVAVEGGRRGAIWIWDFGLALVGLRDDLG